MALCEPDVQIWRASGGCVVNAWTQSIEEDVFEFNVSIFSTEIELIRYLARVLPELQGPNKPIEKVGGIGVAQ